jgi:hypothetical protein
MYGVPGNQHPGCHCSQFGQPQDPDFDGILHLIS